MAEANASSQVSVHAQSVAAEDRFMSVTQAKSLGGRLSPANNAGQPEVADTIGIHFTLGITCINFRFIEFGALAALRHVAPNGINPKLVDSSRRFLVQTIRKIFIATLFVFACACAGMHLSASVQAQSTKPGDSPAVQVFARMLSDLKARRAKDPDADRKSTYDLLTVKVEDWYATEEARFAHALKIPNPVPADSGYRQGMTQQQYFEHLCKTEAGEFIYKTADNVDGILQMRPRRISYDGAEWQHLYAIEDPYGHWEGENERYGYEFVGPLLYDYIELPSWGRPRFKPHHLTRRHKSMLQEPSAIQKIARYFGNDGKDFKSLQLELAEKPKARYAFTWRGIKRPNDREMGIAGGELIVLDLKTNEIMAVRRGYVIWNSGWTRRVCPRYGYDGGQDKATFFSVWFLAKVARPPRYKEFFVDWERTRRIRGDPNDKRY